MKLPENYPFTISTDFGKVDFVDLITVEGIKGRDLNIDKVLLSFFSIKIPFVDVMLKLRNILMMPFGLKGTKNGDMYINNKIPFVVGERATLFKVVRRTDTEIVMSESDKHLDFCVFNLLVEYDGMYTYYCSTVVHYNNRFGRLYFFFVRPFHNLIMIVLKKKAMHLFNSN